MHIALRLICCVTPYAVAGLRFGRGPARIFGVIVRPLDQFAEADLREVFADPRIDISVGWQPTADSDFIFVPVSDVLDLKRIEQKFAGIADFDDSIIFEAFTRLPARAWGFPDRPFLAQIGQSHGTEEILAEHARLSAEQDRDAMLPGGDDELAGDASTDTQADPVANAADASAAAGDKGQDEKAADAPGSSAATPPADAVAADPAVPTEAAAPIDPAVPTEAAAPIDPPLTAAPPAPKRGGKK